MGYALVKVPAGICIRELSSLYSHFKDQFTYWGNMGKKECNEDDDGINAKCENNLLVCKPGYCVSHVGGKYSDYGKCQQECGEGTNIGVCMHNDHSTTIKSIRTECKELT